MRRGLYYVSVSTRVNNEQAKQNHHPLDDTHLSMITVSPQKLVHAVSHPFLAQLTMVHRLQNDCTDNTCCEELLHTKCLTIFAMNISDTVADCY